MSIFVIGMNHTTASIAFREKIYFAADKLSLYLQDILSREGVREAILLSTCNRSELYCDATDISAVQDWFYQQTDLSRIEIEPAVYVYQDKNAVEHIMNVACGLDSMVLGETQILGQMKNAFAESCTAGAIGTLFHQLFQYVFSVAKEVRTATAIGACPVSVASAAVHFAKQSMATLEQKNITLIGSGDTSQLLIRYLARYITKPITVLTRHPEKAANILENVRGCIYGMDQLSRVLLETDLLFSATSSVVPIIHKKMVMEVMSSRPHKPLVLIDIAVPRDIDLAVADISGAHLFCIDDLKSIIEKNRQGREHAASKAREMISQKSSDFMNEQYSLNKVAHTIRAYRSQIEEICQLELLKAKQQLAQGVSPHQVLEMFAHAFTRKMLHEPSVQLRQAGVEKRFELLQVAKQLFAIPDHEVERI